VEAPGHRVDRHRARRVADVDEHTLAGVVGEGGRTLLDLLRVGGDVAGGQLLVLVREEGGHGEVDCDQREHEDESGDERGAQGEPEPHRYACGFHRGRSSRST
jgi:hypothetical protein